MSFADALAEQASRAALIGQYARIRAKSNGLNPDKAQKDAEEMAHIEDNAERIVSAIAGDYRRAA